MISQGKREGDLYEFYCLSSDLADLTEMAEKLGCWQGSTAYCIDTGDLYMWDGENKQFRKQ